MEKLVKITLSPFTPSIDFVDKMVMKVTAPYSDKTVTVQFNPNIQDYKEQLDQPGIQVRQVMLSTTTDQTQKFTFDFISNNVQTITIEGTDYSVKLMNIGKEPHQGQNFLYFEFFITTP
jgi:hypothetical protein